MRKNNVNKWMKFITGLLGKELGKVEYTSQIAHSEEPGSRYIANGNNTGDEQYDHVPIRGNAIYYTSSMSLSPEIEYC